MSAAKPLLRADKGELTKEHFPCTGREIGMVETTARKLMENIAVKGNADREKAFELILDEKAKLKGLVCVLKADLNLEGAEQSIEQ